MFWASTILEGKFQAFDFFTILVGGFNPFEKYWWNWESSPIRGENKKYLKPPSRNNSSQLQIQQIHQAASRCVDAKAGPPNLNSRRRLGELELSKGSWVEKREDIGLKVLSEYLCIAIYLVFLWDRETMKHAIHSFFWGQRIGEVFFREETV